VCILDIRLSVELVTCSWSTTLRVRTLQGRECRLSKTFLYESVTRATAQKQDDEDATSRVYKIKGSMKQPSTSSSIPPSPPPPPPPPPLY
jgi:hypothetical protein